MMLDTSYNSKSPLYANLHKPPPYKSALAERLARIRAQAAAAAAAQQHPADSSQKNRTPDSSGAPPNGLAGHTAPAGGYCHQKVSAPNARQRRFYS
jgi:hypothetical protein